MSARQAAGILAAAAILAWRLWAVAPTELWRDVPAVVALWALVPWKRTDVPALAAAAYLLGLYAAAHGPRVLEGAGLR